MAAALVEALRRDVLAICVGPVTAAPLERRGIAAVQPDRPLRAALSDPAIVQTIVKRGYRLAYDP
jgi:uroporphyrinogen-III synthase